MKFWLMLLRSINSSIDSCNVIYLITCSSCREQYAGSATNFKQRFRIHKSVIKTNKDCCGTARHNNLMINVAVLITKVPISKYRSLNRYLIIISVVLKISYGSKKNIGRHNFLIYLLSCMEWIGFIYYEKERLSKIIFFKLMFNIFKYILSFWF